MSAELVQYVLLQVTLAHLVPPIILGLSKSDATNAFDLSSLRIISSGAAPLKTSQSLEFANKFTKTHLFQGWLLTPPTLFLVYN